MKAYFLKSQGKFAKYVMYYFLSKTKIGAQTSEILRFWKKIKPWKYLSKKIKDEEKEEENLNLFKKLL